jgi:hypothetical protein
VLSCFFQFLGWTIQPKSRSASSFTTVVSSCKTFSHATKHLLPFVVVLLQGAFFPVGAKTLPKFDALIGFGVHAQNAPAHSIKSKVEWN